MAMLVNVIVYHGISQAVIFAQRLFHLHIAHPSSFAHSIFVFASQFDDVNKHDEATDVDEVRIYLIRNRSSSPFCPDELSDLNTSVTSDFGQSKQEEGKI